MATIYVDSVGVYLRQTLQGPSTVGAEISGDLRKPSGSIQPITPTLDGETLTYITKPGELDEIGLYIWEVKIEYPATGGRFFAEPIGFYVWPRDKAE